MSRAALLHYIIIVWLLGDVSMLANMGRGCEVGRKLSDMWALMSVCSGRCCLRQSVGSGVMVKSVVSRWLSGMGAPIGPLVELL